MSAKNEELTREMSYHPDLLIGEEELGIAASEAMIAAEALQEIYERRYRPIQLPPRMKDTFIEF